MARKLAIKMDELVDALDRLDESETDYFLDAQTGEVLMIGSEYLSEDEDGLDEFGGDEEGELAGDGPGESSGRQEPDWIQKERELAKRIAEGGDRYLLIEPFGRHEGYRLMQDFINHVEGAKASDRLQRAIEGKAASINKLSNYSARLGWIV